MTHELTRVHTILKDFLDCSFLDLNKSLMNTICDSYTSTTLSETLILLLVSSISGKRKPRIPTLYIHSFIHIQYTQPKQPPRYVMYSFVCLLTYEDIDTQGVGT